MSARVVLGLWTHTVVYQTAGGTPGAAPTAGSRLGAGEAGPGTWRRQQGHYYSQQNGNSTVFIVNLLIPSIAELS